MTDPVLLLDSTVLVAHERKLTRRAQALALEATSPSSPKYSTPKSTHGPPAGAPDASPSHDCPA